MMSHSGADTAKVLERALDDLVARLEKARFGVGAKARKKRTQKGKRTRHIPMDVRRAVVERDGLRCTFSDDRGHRCDATSMLELHHVDAFGKGGEHSVENVTLRCRAHNAMAAREDFPELAGWMEAFGAPRDRQACGQ